MKLKKYAAPFLAGLLAAVTVTSTASAHPYDYWQGLYLSKNDANIELYVLYTAQTELLTKENVYDYATNWNNISSNVSVSVEYQNTILPNSNGKWIVAGREFNNTNLGRMNPYDASGNLMDTTPGVNSDWSYVRIDINVDAEAFVDLKNGLITPSKLISNARKTFLHEVGHALKLSHPKQNSTLSGHTVSNGRPYAIMNQGYVRSSSDAVAPDIAYHDKICLKTKWGV